MRIAVVIPIYRTPTADEEISLRQCCKVLKRYDHILIAPEGLDTAPFHALWAEQGKTLLEKRFDAAYFSSLKGYNRLCLSREYHTFLYGGGYSHILVYQTDAFVFRDELEEWAAKGYEYVGAPNVGLARQSVYRPNMPLRVGNGGFSLRSLDAILRFFDGKKRVFRLWHILRSPLIWKRNYWWLAVKALRYWAQGAMPTDLLTSWQGNEDDFWGSLLGLSEYALRRPTPEEAMHFAFDRFPKELYERTGQLPMGCHAWRKYEYNSFWKAIIAQHSQTL